MSVALLACTHAVITKQTVQITVSSLIFDLIAKLRQEYDQLVIGMVEWFCFVNCNIDSVMPSHMQMGFKLVPTKYGHVANWVNLTKYHVQITPTFYLQLIGNDINEDKL